MVEMVMSTAGSEQHGQLHRGDEVGEAGVREVGAYAALLDGGEDDVNSMIRARWSTSAGR